MIIGLRGGHSSNCVGAVGIVNEYDQMQKFYEVVAALLRSKGHMVIDCNSNGSNAAAELSEGAAAANNAKVDIFISLHMNASNGQGHGVEALVSSANSKAYGAAQLLCYNFTALGFTNRGVKINNGLYEMNHVAAPNIIFEMCFCDSATDIEIYNNYSWDQLALTFCKSIDPNITGGESVEAKNYVVTNYLPAAYDGYDGVDINYILSYFKGVKTYVRGNGKSIFIETEYLPMTKCEELKNTLGSWFYEIKSE
jgi:N-acetylmuramoyl-L-alanine amidase